MWQNRKQAGSVSGVLYAEDFDAPVIPIAQGAARRPETVEPELIVPSYSLAELQAATTHAHEQGRLIERREAAATASAQRDLALSALMLQLTETQLQATRAVDQALHRLAGTILSLLAAAVPELCRRHSAGELHALMRRVLPPMRQIPALSIRLHPTMRAALQEQVGPLLLDSGTEVTWIEASTLAAGDIAITWQNGTALRDTASIGVAIRDAVLSMLDPETTKLAEPCDDQ
ncbi:hypothetical protein [Lichenicoccus sp.]|uniref:hypothetical protein n=1 Tax=Lichenicoccus sp. TaxID=2781899 RepID=UPI003D0CAAFD